ncbi:MAG: GAF domain-containing protein [Anaerolineales bacterium]|nr:GAF domain-containing protein [Anaerolineales bacterium]
MSNRDNTEEQLIDEVVKLRQRVAELEDLKLELLQTEAELTQRNQQLITVQAAVAAISSSLDLEAVLNAVAREMIRLLEATGCVIYEWDSLADTITIIFEVGPHTWEYDSHRGRIFQLAHFPLTKHVMVKRLAQQMTINQPDVEPAELAYMEECQFKTLLMLPMIFQERVIGLLEIVDEQASHVFNDQELALAQLLANQAASAIENAQFYAAEQKARRVAETLQAANQALTQSLDLITVLETLLDYVSRLVPYDTANVMLVEAGSQIVIQAIRGYEHWTDPEQFRRITFDARTTPSIQTVLASRQSHLIADTYTYPGWQIRPGSEYIRNWLGVPLVVGDQVIGLYSMDKAQTGFFTNEHVQLAEALAPQAAIAIQNAQLFTEAQRRLHELTLLVDSSIAVSMALDVETVLQIIARQVTTVMQIEECAISLWGKEQDVVVTLLDYVAEEWAEPRGTMYPLADYALTRQVLTQNQPLHIHLNDPTIDPAERALLEKWELSSLLMVPLVVRDQVIGLLELMSVTERTFTATEIGLCQTLANQMAAALENARLLEQVQSYANELEQRVAERTTELTRTNAELQTEIIERQQAEEMLTIARDQALAASRFKTELVAKVSHELRTPLTAILGIAELLEMGMYGPVTAPQKQATTKILDSAFYLTDLVNELLDHAKLDARRFSLKPTPFTPATIVEKVRSKMSVLAQNKGLELITTIDDDLPATVIGDPEQIQQILVNLVSNAIKFTKQGRVTVQVYCPVPTHWALQVSDTGPGIPPEAQSYIFEPFRQIDGSITREHGGTGLGLSIVKELTELMAGQIIIDSKVGRGSTFTIMLPLTSNQEKDK